LILGSEDLQWDPAQVVAALGDCARLVANADELLSRLSDEVKSGDHVVFLSNGSFDGAPARFAAARAAAEPPGDG
jgi:UDP-N-acetylmuramate: L-alanyl-gamma-D-glutamyl-meso-diaminopimelate ligase